MFIMMRRRASSLFLAVAAAALMLTRDAAAVDGGANACQLPSGIDVNCTTNVDCVIYSAICNAHKICQCPTSGTSFDMATRSDGGMGGGTGGGTGMTGGAGSSAPIRGGGMIFPPRTGCSYVPGQR
jgi:hypothetical protein